MALSDDDIGSIVDKIDNLRTLDKFARVMWANHRGHDSTVYMAIARRGAHLETLAFAHPMSIGEFEAQKPPRQLFDETNIQHYRRSYGPGASFIKDSKALQESRLFSCPPPRYNGYIVSRPLDLTRVHSLRFINGKWIMDLNGYPTVLHVDRDGYICNAPGGYVYKRMVAFMRPDGHPMGWQECIASLPVAVPYDQTSIEHVRASFGPSARFVSERRLPMLLENTRYVAVSPHKQVKYHGEIIDDDSVIILTRRRHEGQLLTQGSAVGTTTVYGLLTRIFGGYVEICRPNFMWVRLIVII